MFDFHPLNLFHIKDKTDGVRSSQTSPKVTTESMTTHANIPKSRAKSTFGSHIFLGIAIGMAIGVIVCLIIKIVFMLIR